MCSTGLNPEQGAELWRELFAQICHPLEALPCPVIYAAHGLTLTAAFEISLACDIILAAPKAKFGLVETVVGLTPSMGGPQRLAERAGSGRARELVMTGDLYGRRNSALVGASSMPFTTMSMLRRVPWRPGWRTGPREPTTPPSRSWRPGVPAGSPTADSVTPGVSGALFATDDLRGAVRSFLEVGPGKAAYSGK